MAGRPSQEEESSRNNSSTIIIITPALAEYKAPSLAAAQRSIYFVVCAVDEIRRD
jgi:hypothetical protein